MLERKSPVKQDKWMDKFNVIQKVAHVRRSVDCAVRSAANVESKYQQPSRKNFPHGQTKRNILTNKFKTPESKPR